MRWGPQEFLNRRFAVQLSFLIYSNLLVNPEVLLLDHRVNPFPHTTILQQTTLNIFCQNMENLYNWMDNLWLKVENIVAKGEIAHFVQLHVLCNFFFCHYVLKKLSAAEASESVFMRERVKYSVHLYNCISNTVIYYFLCFWWIIVYEFNKMST